jgi:predicted RNase H-like HicB family nuclease
LDKYIFPAIFEPGEIHGYCITFPDLPGIVTSGETIEESLSMAKKALELHLYGMEEDSEIIAEPTSPNKINIPKDGFVNLIEVWMPPVRDEMANRKVKKTLTIPQWLK